MRIAIWNILHGGGPRRVPELALQVLGFAADVVILTEWRRARGGQLAGVLADHGLSTQLASHDDGSRNAVLIASRHEGTPLASAGAHGRIAALRLAGGLVIIGVHVPPEPGSSASNLVWTELGALARSQRDGLAVVAGDFNAGKGARDGAVPMSQRAHLGRLASLGYVDAWRHLHPAGVEHSWSDGRGRSSRVDHALLSRPLVPWLRAASFEHGVREQRVSDHSALLVDLDVPLAASDARSAHASTEACESLDMLPFGSLQGPSGPPGLSTDRKMREK